MPATDPNTGITYCLVGEGGYGPYLQNIVPSLSALTTINSGSVKTHEVPSTSLHVDVRAANYRNADGSLVAFVGVANQLLTDNTTNYIYLNAAGTLTISTSAFPAGANYVPLAIVTTLTGVVTNIADARIPLAMLGRAGQVLPPTIITSATATLTVLQGYVQVNRAGAVALTLPAASTMQPNTGTIIQDISGAALMNNITITRAGADTINGAAAAIIMTNYGGVKLWCDGVSAWFLLP